VRELRATDSQLQWVVDAYNLVFAASVLAAGSLSDRFGRKGMLLAGLAVFGAASLAGGLTDDPGQLIATRAIMGIGSAMVFPSTLSLLTNVFTERGERARAIGLWGATTGAAIALGPIVPPPATSPPGPEVARSDAWLVAASDSSRAGAGWFRTIGNRQCTVKQHAVNLRT
jgi:MFS family permease